MPSLNTHQQRERLRALLIGDQFVHPASVYDALSARAADALGYEMLMLAGSTASLAVLGAPDLVLLTLTEFAEQARRVARATSLPLLVDADHGYGNALNVMRCVQELEAAGVSALSIEDTLLPPPSGGGRQAFISVEEGTGKMRAAVAARTDASLVILGRTGSLQGEGLDSALQRARAYEAAGVDGLFFTGLHARAELEALRAASSLPFVLSGLPAEMQDDAYLVSQGVRIGGWSHRPIQAATRAVYAALRALREEAATGELPAALQPDDVLDTLSQKADYDAAATRYVR